MNGQTVPPGAGGDQNKEYHNDIQAYNFLFFKMTVLLIYYSYIIILTTEN